MLAWIVTNADGVVSDLVVRTLADDPLAAIPEAGDPHLFGDQFAEFQGGTARRVLFVAVMTLEYFHVGVMFGQGPGADLGQFHADVHAHAHVRGENERDHFGRFVDDGDLIRSQAGRCNDERDPALNAKTQQRFQARRLRKVDHHIRLDVLGQLGGKRDAKCVNSRVQACIHAHFRV